MDMLADIKYLLGDEYKKLKKPIFLLVIDSLFNMVFYGMLFKVLLDLLNSDLNIIKIRNYTIIMIVAFVLRILVLRRGFTDIQVEGSQATKKMRISLGNHLRNLPLGYFNENSIGSLTNIMTNDLQDFERVITHSTSDLIRTVTISIYLLSMTFFVDRTVGLIQLLIVLVALPIIYYGGVRAQEIGKKKKVVINDVISRMIEFLSGIQVFKSYNMEGEKFERLEQSFSNFKKESIRTEVTVAPYVLIFQTIVDLSFPVLLLISVSKFIGGSLSNQELLTFIVINLALTNILRAFGAQYGEFKYLKLASEKLIEVYDEKELDYVYEEVSFDNYNIEFKNVNFEYEKGDPILKDVSFLAKEETMTALVGPSGSGKTTVTSLIARFFDIQSGTISVGGLDIKDINPDELLKSISMVFQDVYLINDTIYNNIRMGNRNASREEILKAAEAASCHDFIDKLPDGYETMVGEGGSTLSGGEKQRISIARAILKDAPIILFDEATASLDADNEKEIRKSIDKMTDNKTVIVIAHRLNTIKNADNIIVLNDGEIEEMGNHNRLMENEKRYYDMYTEMIRAKEWSI